MREIKFRAFYKGERYPIFEGGLEEYEKPRMIYNIQDIYDGSGADDSGNGVGHVSCFGSFLDDEDYIVGQYTGLKDKNGVEIYEGDIIAQQIKVDEYINIKAINFGPFEDSVDYFVYNGVGFYTVDNKGEEQGELSYMIDIADYEVIGNIYEHPELLGDNQ